MAVQHTTWYADLCLGVSASKDIFGEETNWATKLSTQRAQVQMNFQSCGKRTPINHVLNSQTSRQEWYFTLASTNRLKLTATIADLRMRYQGSWEMLKQLMQRHTLRYTHWNESLRF